jgi:hypothetical protein
VTWHADNLTRVEFGGVDLTGFIAPAPAPRLAALPDASMRIDGHYDLRLDNSDSVFVPVRRVYIEIAGHRSGPYLVDSWANAGRAITAAFARRARLSRMRSAYRARRR